MDRNALRLVSPALMLSAALIYGRSYAATPPSAGSGATLRLPILSADARPPVGPGYLEDRIVVRLNPPATRAAALSISAHAALLARGAAAAPISGAIRPRFTALGLAGLDRASQALGAWLEPEFAGESPPRVGTAGADFTSFYILHLPAGADLVAALDRLRAAPEVASAEPVAQVPLAVVPNDSLWSESWWLDQASGRDLDAPAAWNVTTGDTAVVVAVLDSGILRTHPDLGGAKSGDAGQLWTNWAEANGVPGVDDDHNGFIDDTWGWDFISSPPAGGSPSGEDALDEDNDPNDFIGHGTSVAGLIGAITNNSIGMSGVVWNARLMSVRVAVAVNGSAGGAVAMSDAAQGILYAVRNGASVINCSFGTVTEPDLQAAVDEAVRSGVTVVMAAGNSSQSHDLADREDVIAVAATDAQDQVASFSNTGSFVDVSAPGTLLISTSLVHVAGDSVTERTPAYDPLLNGTSFATPLVTGAAALVQARQRALGEHPLTPMGMLLRLRETTDDMAAQNPGVSGYGTGRLDLARAVLENSLSSAFRAGAPAVGPAVVLPGTSGRSGLAFVTSDAQLIVLSVTGDTLARAPLPGLPAQQLAAADLGGGLGAGLFVGTMDGKVAGFDARGVPLAGWPRSGQSAFYPMGGGPALGDLDGDGVPEVVCGSGDGNVYAWRVGGARVLGFPSDLVGGAVSLPVALAPIDGQPGSEIVAITDFGNVHVLGPSGADLPNWPVSVAGAPVAPIVTRLGSSPSPVIVVAAGNHVHAFNPDGSERWSAALPGNAIAAPAAADLDQDGYDEILVPTIAPSTLTVLDTSGVAWSAAGFPIALPAAPAGPVEVGPLGAAGAPAALLMLQGGLAAYTASGQSLARFPEPGGAGAAPVIAELDGDGDTEVTAGSGPDSLFYIYDAGPGTFAVRPSMWPAPRANDARTGSRLGAPSLSPSDDIPPAAVADLAAAFVAPDSVALVWTAPGSDGAVGTAARYQLRISPNAGDVTDFSLGAINSLPAPSAAGTSERYAFVVNAPGTLLYFCVRALDAAGNAALASNVPALLLPSSDGTVITTLSAASVRDSTVRLNWRAPGAALSSYDVRGSRSPIDDASWSSAPLIRALAPSGGASDSIDIGGLEPGATWWFAVRAVPLGGTAGPISNSATLTVPTIGWLAGHEGLAIAPHVQPSRHTVQFDWQGVPGGSVARVEIFDVTGRKLRTFPLEYGRWGGSVQWNGRDDEQHAVPAGLYFARLNCGSIHAQTRVVLLP
ncbi:MAG: S8 family serine peptidase [Candidatus Eiseniibacteriota bacterium]